MAYDQRDGSLRCASLEPSRQLRRQLRRYSAKVDMVRNAESAYHDVILVESLRPKSKLKRSSGKRIDAAFDALVDAVVELQGAELVVLSRAEEEGIPLEAICALDETFESAERECAGYLTARTYDQVHKAAREGAIRGRAG